jgi:hypothetical protein
MMLGGFLMLYFLPLVAKNIGWPHDFLSTKEKETKLKNILNGHLMFCPPHSRRKYHFFKVLSP